MPLPGRKAQSPLTFLIVVIALIGCGAFVYWMATDASVAKQTAEDSARISKLRTVSTALETFKVAHTEYPPALGALLEDSDIPPFLSRQTLDQPGYSYEYKPTPDNFALHLKPDSGEGAYYVTDKTGEVRVSLNAPAGSASPLWSR